MPLIVDKRLSILESDHDISTGVFLKNKDWVQIHSSGRVWAGLWFTPENGPEGLRSLRSGNNFPLPSASPFSLLGKTAADGYFLIGDSLERTYLNQTSGSGETELYLRINDDLSGNGTGAFVVHIQVWR